MLSYEQAGDFSALEEDCEDNFNPDTGEIMLGDIVISVTGERAGCRLRTQRAQGICVSDQHSFICSVDHMTPEDAAVMEPSRDRFWRR